MDLVAEIVKLMLLKHGVPGDNYFACGEVKAPKTLELKGLSNEDIAGRMRGKSMRTSGKCV